MNNFIKIDNHTINAFSTLFEDNAGVLQLANEPKFRLRTKHVGVKYYHFHKGIKNEIISVEAINTDKQADIFTKQSALDKFRKFRGLIMGW